MSPLSSSSSWLYSGLTGSSVAHKRYLMADGGGCPHLCSIVLRLGLILCKYCVSLIISTPFILSLHPPSKFLADSFTVFKMCQQSQKLNRYAFYMLKSQYPLSSEPSNSALQYSSPVLQSSTPVQHSSPALQSTDYRHPTG